MPDTDAVDLLIHQHDEIRRLLRTVETSMGVRRAHAFDRLRRLLAVHETAEEEIVHPLIRHGMADGHQVIRARLAADGSRLVLLGGNEGSCADAVIVGLDGESMAARSPTERV
jgi:hypothetical protein